MENLFKKIMIARVLKTKGYLEFIETAHISKEIGLKIDFYLCGGLDDAHPSRITKEKIGIAESEHIIQYIGHLSNLQQFISYADCVVLPSYDNEGMSRSLEALSMGISIITTDNRGCRELVLNDVTGFVILSRSSKLKGLI